MDRNGATDDNSQCRGHDYRHEADGDTDYVATKPEQRTVPPHNTRR